MPTDRWISRMRRSSELLNEKASGGSSQWTATISPSIAFTDESVFPLSRKAYSRGCGHACRGRLSWPDVDDVIRLGPKHPNNGQGRSVPPRDGKSKTGAGARIGP